MLLPHFSAPLPSRTPEEVVSPHVPFLLISTATKLLYQQSTRMSLIKLTSNFYFRKLGGHLSVLILLSPSAAEFDSVDHSFLLTEFSFLNRRMALSHFLLPLQSTILVSLHLPNVLKLKCLRAQSLNIFSIVPPLVISCSFTDLITIGLFPNYIPFLYSKPMYPTAYLNLHLGV